MSILARNPERPVAYDDALHGLPNRHHHKPDMARRAKTVSDAIGAATALRSVKAARRAEKIGPGYRYRGYLQVGIIVTAVNDVGSMAQEAMRGIVFQTVDTGQVSATGSFSKLVYQIG